MKRSDRLMMSLKEAKEFHRIDCRNRRVYLTRQGGYDRLLIKIARIYGKKSKTLHNELLSKIIQNAKF